MAAGDIVILGTEHLPKEKVLLIHYSINTVGTWIYDICNCGYRNVCDTEWTIMIPNHQHPRHTDARIGHPLIVQIKGKKGTFAWNYGGVPGIKAEHFDKDHSYLIQLTMVRIAGCKPDLPPGQPGLTGSRGGGNTNTGVSGRRTIPPKPKPRPINPRIPGGPGRPVPGLPKPPPPPPPPPPPGPPIPIGPDPYSGYSGRPIDPPPPSGPIPRPLPPTGPITPRPVPDGPSVPGIPGIPSVPPPIGRIPKKGGGEPPPGTPNIDQIHFWVRPEPSAIFGDGGIHFSPMDPIYPPGYTDVTEIDTGKYDIIRDVSPDTVYDPEPPEPTVPTDIVENTPIGIDVALPVPGSGTSTRTPLNLKAAEMGYANKPSMAYSAPHPKGDKIISPIFDKGLGDAQITLTRAVVTQGDFVGVISSFTPPEGGEIEVSAVLYVEDPQGRTVQIDTLDFVMATYDAPASLSSVLRTDFIPIGVATVYVVFRDRKGIVAGAAKVSLGVVEQPTAEPETPILDVESEDSISQSLVDLTEVDSNGLQLTLPSGFRYLIYSAATSASLKHSIVVYPVEEDSDPRMACAVYDLADTATGTFNSGNYDVFRFTSDPLYEADGPTTVGGRPVYQDEHILGHTPVSVTATDTVVYLQSRGLDEQTELNVHVHKDFYLRPVTRTAASRNSTKVDLTYDVPYAAENIGLLVRGYNSGDLPLDPTLTYALSNVSGSVTFSGITASKDQYITLYRAPYRYGIDDIYTEVVDI